MSTAVSANSTPHQIMDRISLVLDAFEGPGRLTLAQTTAKTGLPRSTVHRLLERLVGMRWLSREGNSYELGTRLMELGSLAVRQNRLYNAALPVLHELHRVTGHLVHLGILEGDDVVYLEKVGTRGSLAAQSRVGGRYPAQRSPIGRALLASAPGAVLPQSDPDLARVRDQGVAYVRTPQFAGIGVPIMLGGDIIAAVSICGAVGQLALDHRAAAPVRIAANSIAQSLSLGPANIAPILQRHNQLRAMPTAALQPRLQYA